MLNNFDKYNQEIIDFRRSHLFPEKYKAVIHYLYEEINREPVISKRLESIFDLSGPEIREIIKYARRNGHPVASNNYGYYIEMDYDKCMENIIHLEERAMSQLFTVNRMRQLCPQNQQLKMRFA